MAARYEVEWSRRALRSLERLPEGVATAAIELAYGAIARHPRRVGKPLRFEFEGMWSARRGDYRIIYEVLDDRKVIVVAAIEHRSDAYRRR